MGLLSTIAKGAGALLGGDTIKEFNNATIETNGSIYEGTENTVKKRFNLEYKSEDIFRRNFDGSSAVSVNIDANKNFS